MFFVYAISNLSKNDIYVGLTDNVIRRFHEHNDGHVKTTKPYAPFELIFTSECPDRTSARRIEKNYNPVPENEYKKNVEGRLLVPSLSQFLTHLNDLICIKFLHSFFTF